MLCKIELIEKNVMIKFSKVLAINCLICLAIGSIAWVSTGIIIGLACTYSLTVEELFKLSTKDKLLLDNGDTIGFAFDGIEILLMMIFPYTLVVTLSLGGKIAYTQTLAKSQRGREFVERVKSLDESFSKALRKLVGDSNVERIKSLDESFGKALRKLAGDRTDTL
jgi:hypothetical protein